jgi:hypothetical protein
MAFPLKLPFPLLSFYHRLYCCMNCSGATSDKGVRPFVLSGPDQTLPVSHFGQISTAKIWLVPTNPKGDRTDWNVGFKPTGFVDGAALTDEQVQETFDHFSSYFQQPTTHSFFDPWIALLDGIEVDGERRSWKVKEDGRGGICAVDLIKCPTLKDWGSFVRNKENQPDKKLVYRNCFEDTGPGQFLNSQIRLHQPRVLIFAGTASCLSQNREINKDDYLFRLWPKQVAAHRKGIWTFGSPQRLSIDLGAAEKIRGATPDLLKTLKDAIQMIIWSWQTRIISQPAS